MFALILAGGRLDASDPFFLETQVANKALIPLLGQPMVQWVASALLNTPFVSGLIVVGLAPETLVSAEKPIYYVADRGGMVDNAIAGAEQVKALDPDFTHLLLSSADIPLLTPLMVTEFVSLCQQYEADAYYSLVTQTVMEARFPNSGRTFTRMKDHRYCGGDLFYIARSAIENINYDLLYDITTNRKNFLRQARQIGFGFIIRFLLGQMDAQEAAHRASKAFNITGQVVPIPHAEVAMDVDKLKHYRLVQQALADRKNQT